MADYVDEKQRELSRKMMALNRNYVARSDADYGGLPDLKKGGYMLGRSFGEGLSGAGFSGGSFWSDFRDGFMSVIKPAASVAKVFLPSAAKSALEVVGLGKKSKGKKSQGVAEYKKDNKESFIGGSNGLIKVEEKDGKQKLSLPEGINTEREPKLIMKGGRMETVGNDMMEGGALLGPDLKDMKGGALLAAGMPKKKKGGRRLLFKEEMPPSMMFGGMLNKTQDMPKENKEVKKGGKKGKNGKSRAEIVKQVMKEKGLSLIEASKYVKQHGLY